MDFSTFIGSLVVFIILMALSNIRTYHKDIWEKIVFPGLILMSVFTTVPVFTLLYATFRMMEKPRITVLEKALYVIGAVGVIVFLLWLNVICWRKWQREQKKE